MSDRFQKTITETDLLDAFRHVLREDYPNPNREHCPDPSVLQAMADAPADKIPIDKLILRHIGECWPCLNDLKRLREKKKR